MEISRICQEFDTISARALKVPETTAELMEMVEFVAEARDSGMRKLTTLINESRERMQYMLDTYFFPESEIDLNSEVLLWPQRINPIFDENDEVKANNLLLCQFAFARFLSNIVHLKFYRKNWC